MGDDNDNDDDNDGGRCERECVVEGDSETMRTDRESMRYEYGQIKMPGEIGVTE